MCSVVLETEAKTLLRSFRNQSTEAGVPCTLSDAIAEACAAHNVTVLCAAGSKTEHTGLQWGANLSNHSPLWMSGRNYPTLGNSVCPHWVHHPPSYLQPSTFNLSISSIIITTRDPGVLQMPLPPVVGLADSLSYTNFHLRPTWLRPAPQTRMTANALLSPLGESLSLISLLSPSFLTLAQNCSFPHLSLKTSFSFFSISSASSDNGISVKRGS